MLVPTDKQKYKLSNFKYMGLLRKPNPNEPPPPSTYWNLGENDYSKLTEKLKRQKMNK